MYRDDFFVQHNPFIPARRRHGCTVIFLSCIRRVVLSVKIFVALLSHYNIHQTSCRNPNLDKPEPN